jgi:hypothetical protein
LCFVPFFGSHCIAFLNVFYSLSSGTFKLTLQFTEDHPNKGRDGRRVSSPPNTFLQILATQLFFLRTRSISLHLIISTAARSISLRLLLSDNQISLHYSRISRNQPDLLTLLTHLSEPTRSGSLSRRSVDRSFARKLGERDLVPSEHLCRWEHLSRHSARFMTCMLFSLQSREIELSTLGTRHYLRQEMRLPSFEYYEK